MSLTQNRTGKQHLRGFTLIEMMIVVAIMGIMATLALPTFMDRVIRAQISEGITLAEIGRQAVQDSWRKTGRMPRDNKAAGLPEAQFIVGNYVSAMSIEDGVISITYGQRANIHLAGKRVSLRPAVVDGQPIVPIAWVCGLATVPDRMSARGNNRTDLAPNLLPIDCRS